MKMICLKLGVGLAAVCIGFATSPSDASQSGYLMLQPNGNPVHCASEGRNPCYQFVCPESPFGKSEAWVRENCNLKLAGSDEKSKR